VSEARLRDELCRIGRSLHARGYVHGTTGNVSARLHDGFLITATDGCLGDLDPAALDAARAIAANTPGVAIVAGDNGSWHRARSALVTDDQAERAAVTYSHLTPDWSVLTSRPRPVPDHSQDEAA